MKYITFGKTNIKISSLELECWAFAGDKHRGNQNEKTSINTVMEH